MDKYEHHIHKKDLYPMGKAYQSSLFHQGENTVQQNLPYQVIPPYSNSYNTPYHSGGHQTPPFGNLPLKDIKSFIDRMGGIDGIMSLLNKVNSLVKTVQQMAPMLRLVVGSFSQAKTTNHHTEKCPPIRKKRRRKKRRHPHRKPIKRIR